MMPNPAAFSNSILGLLKKHWLPLIVAIIAIVFIALNRVQAQVNFLFFRVDTALWLALSVAAILGRIVGWFINRK